MNNTYQLSQSGIEMKNQLIHLPISTNYVGHWGFWEAIREILQNAIDTGDYSVNELQPSGIIKINSNTGAMDLSTLMLGESSKRDDSSKIGKYGEGYKLALLVLCRLGHDVLIKNGVDCWRVSIDKHPQLNTDCLTIEVIKNTYTDESDDNEVSFVISGLTDDHFEVIRANYLGESMSDFDVIAENEGSYCFEYDDYDVRKVFVGGLFVCDLPEDKNYRYSYNFAANVLELDRDRKSVDTFYLQYEATRLLSESGDFETLSYLANNNYEDVSDYYSTTTGSVYSSSGEVKNKSEVMQLAFDGFIKKNGENAFPINADFNSEKRNALTKYCMSAGLIPVVVSKALYDMLPDDAKKTNSVEIKGKISTALDAFIERNKKHMRSKAKKELLAIIDSLKLNGN